MQPGLVSVIIPTFNHAAYLPDAIDAVLGQDWPGPIECVVVDDRSTDGTDAWLSERYRLVKNRDFPQPRYLVTADTREHGGPGAARNIGLKLAQGEFVAFLDADDLIAPDKIRLQVEALADLPEYGWSTCDVEIQEARGVSVLASERYNYAWKMGDAWLQPHLYAANFLPIMAPLVRREVIGAHRFRESGPVEDWFFWFVIAGEGRCRYVPRVLATYRKRPGGRNATPARLHPAQRPGVELPLRLNLGCGTPDTRSWHPMPGHVNLDRGLGWRFEDGLADFGNGSVAGVTISHALMYVARAEWPAVLRECARVLEPGGVLRITEDDTATPGSARIGGWRGSEPARTLTNPTMARRELEACGFTVYDVTAETSHFRDRSLCQAQHGAAPDVFFLEGVRECAVLFTPHADDETLFAAFTVIRHRPRVVVCFPSSGDYGDTAVRLEETRAAMAILGGGPVEQWGEYPRAARTILAETAATAARLEANMRDLDRELRPTRVFAPAVHTSHPDHVAVSLAAGLVFGPRVVYFHTYNGDGKVRHGDPVPFEPGWVELKRRALACYQTQIEHPRAREFFRWDLAEFMP